MDDAGGGLRGTRPHGSAALSEAVERSYGLSLSAARDLGGSANLNLLVPRNRESFVVRAYRRHVTDDRLRAIQRAREHLAARGVPCAVAIRSTGGERHIRVGEHLVEVEPYVEADAKMDSLEHVAQGMPTLGRIHDLLAGLDLADAARAVRFANYVDPAGLVDATRAGTDRIRSWSPTSEEVAIADAADRLAEVAAEAQEPFANLPRQLVHGDFWDDNVLLRRGELVLVGDFDFMAERSRVDDLALTLYFTTYLLDEPVGPNAGGELATLVNRYDAGSDRPLTTTERSALPVALARQSLWSISTWAASLDNVATARRHLRDHLAAVQRGLAILSELDRYQAVFG